MSAPIRIGVIGGSGLYSMDALEDITPMTMETPFGRPSDDFVVGTLDGVRVAFLPRHGRGHRFSPAELNYRANIHAFKQLGATHIISVTAVGSLREEMRPLDIVLPDQLVDRTRERNSTFFGNGIVAHIPFAEPFCPDLRRHLYRVAKGQGVGARVHRQGTLVTIEGPAFSTRAETNLYRQWGLDIIGMTTLQEAKLAREAEICYAAMAMVTDYDCWHRDAGEVNVAAVVAHMQKNVETAKGIIQRVVPQIPSRRDCPCGNALDNAIMTDEASFPADTRQKLQLIIDRATRWAQGS